MHLPLPKVPNRKKLKPMKRIAVMVNPDDYSVPVSSMAANAAPAAGAIMPAKDDLTLSLDAFIRSVGVRRATPHTLFLGAGASVSSGVPSAPGCIWEWKRNLFLTNNPGLSIEEMMIVCGYSGRDCSIMETLHAAYSTNGGGALYWCGYSDGDIPICCNKYSSNLNNYRLTPVGS
jgi:hypothetical protein